MIEQLKNYLSNNSCDYERDSKQEILLNEDRIQIYFSVDEDYDVIVTGLLFFDIDGSQIYSTEDYEYEVETLLNEWVKPSDNTVVIEGRSYEI